MASKKAEVSGFISTIQMAMLHDDGRISIPVFIKFEKNIYKSEDHTKSGIFTQMK